MPSQRARQCSAGVDGKGGKGVNKGPPVPPPIPSPVPLPSTVGFPFSSPFRVPGGHRRRLRFWLFVSGGFAHLRVGHHIAGAAVLKVGHLAGEVGLDRDDGGDDHGRQDQKLAHHLLCPRLRGDRDQTPTTPDESAALALKFVFCG
eukprot:1173532-Prorocentrum_minimum.AAC.1